ncbi:hypothetical protein GCM10007973_28410 [Polymorphobacter multimanifer]|nr:hypothetical protein [Polymorphobacter multimanifer]GGI90408.1 hypothetical protein GCM10007973_28410 [Polymorphobacter multimanifer]
MFPSGAWASIPECHEAQASAAVASGVVIEEVKSDDAQLQLLRVTARRGAFMHIYFDENSEADARRYAACLGTQLNLHANELLDQRTGAQLASVVFTADLNYIPARGEKIKTRWVIFTDPKALEGLRPRPMVIKTLPHEQIHDFQSRNGAIAPLWFEEGHATWAGLRITGMLDPEAARVEREERLAELRSANGPVNLSGWGQRKVKRETILRQVSPEDRVQMESDPNFYPKDGSYTFTIDDFETDESMAGARYAAALLMFEGLEQRHGANKVRRWVLDVTQLRPK